MRFSGKVALVTGGARGIGLEVAALLSREGASIVAADIDKSGVTRAVGELDSGLALDADVADPVSVNAMVTETVRAFGRLDILVNNAGIGHTKAFLDTPLAEWEHVLRVNLTGCFLCAQAAARVMVRQGSGNIVNIGSISGQRGGSGRGAYGAAKAGVMQLTRVMALELAPYGIRVNSVAPGPTETDQVRECHDEATRNAYYGLLPLRRYASPKEIASAVAFLASDESSFVTGHILNVDGGFGAAGLMFDANGPKRVRCDENPRR